MIEKPAIALIELRSIARGLKTCDEMMKKAPVQLLEARTLCPGKYMILVAGSVAPVEESFNKGMEIGDDMVVEELFLPNAHEQLIPAMEVCTTPPKVDALAVLETFTVASTILAADASAKAANISLIEMRLANGLGGKSFYTMTGEIAEIEAAVDAGKKAIEDMSTLVAVEIMPRPHKDLVLKVG